MRKKIVLLKPTEVEVIRNHPTNARLISPDADPLKYYKPIIDQFSKLAIGRFFWFILDFSCWRHVTGGGAVAAMTPLSLADFHDADNMVLHTITHPHDIPSINAFTEFWMRYYPALPKERQRHTKATLYFRILNKEGEYYWVMVQYVSGIFDESNRWMYGMVFVTDISHIKTNGVAMMSVLDTTDTESQQFFYTGQQLERSLQQKPILTPREMDVIKLLSTGHSSKQIAAKLNLAIKTIDNHRQNMLRKTNTRSSAELVNFCLLHGLLTF